MVKIVTTGTVYLLIIQRMGLLKPIPKLIGMRTSTIDPVLIMFMMDNLSDVLLSDSDVIIKSSYMVRHFRGILLTLILLDLLFDSIFSLFPTE